MRMIIILRMIWKINENNIDNESEIKNQNTGSHDINII